MVRGRLYSTTTARVRPATRLARPRVLAACFAARTRTSSTGNPIKDAAICARCAGSSAMLSAATSASSIVGLSRRTRRRPHFVFQVAPIGPSSLFLLALSYQKCCTATNEFRAGGTHPMWLRTDYDVRFRLLDLTRVSQQV